MFEPLSDTKPNVVWMSLFSESSSFKLFDFEHLTFDWHSFERSFVPAVQHQAPMWSEWAYFRK